MKMFKAGLGSNYNVFPSLSILLVDWTALLSSQEAHGQHEAAAEIRCVGGRICPQNHCSSCIPQIAVIVDGF